MFIVASLIPVLGGMGTAGLGGMGGPYRLDGGNDVFQVAQWEKDGVPEDVSIILILLFKYMYGSPISATMRHCSCGGLMLGHLCRWWPYINPTLRQCLMFLGNPMHHMYTTFYTWFPRVLENGKSP